MALDMSKYNRHHKIPVALHLHIVYSFIHLHNRFVPTLEAFQAAYKYSDINVMFHHSGYEFPYGEQIK